MARTANTYADMRREAMLNRLLAQPYRPVTPSRKTRTSRMYRNLAAAHANHVPYAHYTAAAPEPPPRPLVLPVYAPPGYGKAKMAARYRALLRTPAKKKAVKKKAATKKAATKKAATKKPTKKKPAKKKPSKLGALMRKAGYR